MYQGPENVAQRGPERANQMATAVAPRPSRRDAVEGPERLGTLGVGKGMGRGLEALRMALRTFCLVSLGPAQEPGAFVAKSDIWGYVRNIRIFYDIVGNVGYISLYYHLSAEVIVRTKSQLI